MLDGQIIDAVIAAKIRGLHVRIGFHDVGGAAHDDPAAFHQIGMLDDVERHGGILLDQ